MKASNLKHLIKHYILAKGDLGIASSNAVASGNEESRIYNQGKVDGIELSLAILDLEKVAMAAERAVLDVIKADTNCPLSQMMSIIEEQLEIRRWTVTKNHNHQER